MAAEPVDSSLEPIILDVRAAADDVAVFDGGVARFQGRVRDREAADTGAGHAAGAGVFGHVAPGAVVVLSAAPILLGEFPGFAADLDSNALAVVQGEDGELGIAVVAAGAGIGPGAFTGAIFDLVRFEPADVARD